MSEAGIRKYKLAELSAIANDERHAVRDEALRRHAIAVRKLRSAKSEIEQLEKLLKTVQ